MLRLKQRRLVILAVCPVGLAILGLLIEATIIAIRQPYHGIFWSLAQGQVLAVAPDSPAAAANIQEGDLILAIGGQPIEDSLRDSALGPDRASLLIARGSQQFLVNLQFIRPPALEIIKRLIPLSVALCFSLFSFAIWTYKPYDWTVIMYWLFSQLGAVGLALGELSNLGLPFATRWFGILLCILSPVLMHFHLLFANIQRHPIQRWVLASLYALALLGASWWWNFAVPVNSQLYDLLGKSTQMFFMVTVLGAVGVLVYAYYTYTGSLQRGRIRLVMWGTFMAFLPLIGFGLLPDMVVNRNIVAYEFTFPFLLFIPVAYAVAIYQYNLMQIERVINRSIVHLVLFLILARIYLSLLTALPRLWGSSWAEQPMAWGLISLLLVTIFTPLRTKLQALADNLFYGGWYNYRSVVSEMSHGLSGVVDRDELAGLLVDRLSQILRLSGAALLLQNKDDSLVLIKMVGFESLPLTLNMTGNLPRKLLQMAQPIPAVELQAAVMENSLSSEEQAWLANPQIHTWVPITRSQKLRGVLFLAMRLDGEVFDDDDRRMLATLAWEAAIAVENIELVRTLRQRTKEVNLLYSQLIQNREEERKRVARDLHDSIIQDLINLHFCLNPNTYDSSMLAKEEIMALRRRLLEVIDDLRQVCMELRPAALDDLSLAFAIQGYLEDVTVQYGLDIKLILLGDQNPTTQRLPEEVEISLFRVLQEAITNVHRHAEAKHVQVTLSLEPNQVSLEISDDGRGFHWSTKDLSALARNRHFGLAGLQERLYLIAGSLHIESTPGQGTTLRATVPLTHALLVEEETLFDNWFPLNLVSPQLMPSSD